LPYVGQRVSEINILDQLRFPFISVSEQQLRERHNLEVVPHTLYNASIGDPSDLEGRFIAILRSALRAPAFVTRGTGSMNE
jgi:hypothetical protein